MRRLLVLLVFVASTVQMGGVAEATSCPFPDGRGSYHKGTFQVNHRNLANVVAWRITLQGQSCVYDGKITAVRWNKWHYVNPDLKNWWVFEPGWTDTVYGGGVGQDHVYRRVHAALKLCWVVDIGGVTCVKKAYPWIAMTMTNGPAPWFVEVSGSKGM